MTFLNDSDVVRIGGRVFTRSRAIAMGLVVPTKKGLEVTEKGEALSNTQSAKIARAEASAREWRRKQGIEEPETTEDGVIKRRKKVEPLKPRNVDHSGQEITDEEELARIAAETEALEAARIAAEEDAAAGLVIPPPAEPTEAEIEAEGRADEAD